MKRDLARLLKAARRDGWRVERTRKSHWRLRHPSGAIVVTGSSPSCPRSLLNLRADLRRTERRAFFASGPRAKPSTITER